MISLIEERMRMDPIAKFLVEKSSITMVQLDTYVIEMMGSKNGISLSDKIRLRDGQLVTKGAFLRTLKQASKQIERSICTIIVAEYLGLLDRGTISSLMKVGELIASISYEDLSKEHNEKIIAALENILHSLGRAVS